MKHLIITGDQCTGKSTLARWVSKLSGEDVFHGISAEDIKRVATNHSKSLRPNRVLVFTTNIPVTYQDFNKNDFLIIRLSHPLN